MIKIATVLLIVLALHHPANCLTDNEKINEIWYGVFAQNRLPRPQYLLRCFDDESASRIIKLAATILPQLAKVIPPIKKIKDEVMQFTTHMDQGLIWCMGYDYEVQDLGWALGIAAGSSPQEILREFEVYIALHLPKTHHLLVHMNKLFNEGKFYDMGFLGSIFAHEVLKGKNKAQELAGDVALMARNLLTADKKQ